MLETYRTLEIVRLIQGWVYLGKNSIRVEALAFGQ